jgi:DNA-binding transcriptional regulator GbsR (MarR family)
MADERKLTPVQERFILHWGEMGTKWGINRTVAQIHALLFISPRPLPAEDIAETLGVARSNVSTSLRELQGWGIVRRVHVMGDRRDHFDSLKDVWELFRTIAEERKKREVNPTLSVLRECIAEVDKAEQPDEYTEARLRELLGFFETTTGWYQQLRGWSPTALSKLAGLGDKALKLIGVKADAS